MATTPSQEEEENKNLIETTIIIPKDLNESFLRDKFFAADIDSRVNKFRNQYLKREKALEESFAKKEAQIAEREILLQNNNKRFEGDVADHEKEVRLQREKVASEWKAIEQERLANDNKLKLRLEEIAIQRKNETENFNSEIKKINAEREKFEKEHQDKIKLSSKTFIDGALTQLKFKEYCYQALSILWNILGAVALGVGSFYLIKITYNTTITLPQNPTWEVVTFSTLKGLVIITLIAGFSRYAYLLSKAYLKESTKNSDRRHAINYGKFYLETYGALSDWPQVKEVFENWNINNSSEALSNKTDDLELGAIDKVTTIIERIAKIVPSISISNIKS